MPQTDWGFFRHYILKIMERQVKLIWSVGPFIHWIWLIVPVLLVGCIAEDGLNPIALNQFETAEDEECHEMHVHWEETLPGHDFSKSGPVTLYFLENPMTNGEILEIFLVSKDRSKQSQFRIPGNGKDNLSNYSIAMIPNTYKEGAPCIQISLVSGPGENYDEIVILFRK